MMSRNVPWKVTSGTEDSVLQSLLFQKVTVPRKFPRRGGIGQHRPN